MLRILETTNHYLNYGDALLENIIFTDWARQKLNVMMLSLWAMILRFHFISMACWLCSVNIYVDFFLHTAISIVVTFYRNWFYWAVEYFDARSTALVGFLIENYTIQNYRLWKRSVLLGICIYGIIVCCVVEITSGMMIVYILEYAIAFIVVDVVENKTVDKIIREYKNRPRHTIHASFNIDENYGKTPDVPLTQDLDAALEDSGTSTGSQSVGEFNIMVIDDY